MTDRKTTSGLEAMGKRARQAARGLGSLPTDARNGALEAIAERIDESRSDILAANARDLQSGRNSGLSDALLDRLLLNQQRITDLVSDTRRLIDLPDPCGVDFDSRVLPNGLRIKKRRVPIGVLGVIYEARPNVTIDVATLCIKTGNAVILRGGKETLHSNVSLADIIRSALSDSDLPPNAVQCIADPDRSLVTSLLHLDTYVDMIVPRGGAALHELCKRESRIPVITGGIGICHIFVDESADLIRAVDIVENAKVQRPSVCNALDTILVHRKVAARFLPEVARRLAVSGVEIRADSEALTILTQAATAARVVAAGEGDFDEEWLSLIMGAKIVADLDEAIGHIHDHSTEHSDSILTNDSHNADRFTSEVDSAAVYVNASTRFTDGGQFGLGAEVAVSTQKLHARGPMGLEELTTYKWVVIGDGHIRE